MAFNIFLYGVLILSVTLVVTSSGEVVRVVGDDAPAHRELRVPCDRNSTPLWSCHDCETRLLCTPLGGVLLRCWLPGPHCVDGACSRDPSEQCTSTVGPSPPTDGPTTSY